MCRLLDRKFDIFNCVGVINNLITDDLIDYTEKDGVKHFILNEKGNQTLHQQRDKIIEMLREKFPNEIDIINKL
jgi:hypothetical protein